MTYEHDRALMEGARNSACDDYFSARPQIDNIDRRRVYEAGFQAGAASRDAEVVSLTNQRDYEYVRAENAEQERDQFEQVRDQLRAQINVLRDGMEQLMRWQVKNVDKWHNSAYDNADHILTRYPEQSLAEYRNKVIEAFVNEFSRHVGGDGEFWLHELKDFAMKEQP